MRGSPTPPGLGTDGPGAAGGRKPSGSGKTMAIERGHFTISRSLMRRLAIKNPHETLLAVRGQDLRGQTAADYLDSLPPERVWLSDCPQRQADGACECLR